MVALFSKLFKPKWQNPKVDIRLQAINELNSSSAEDQAILREIVKNDEDTQVKTAALKKVNDINLLTDITKQHANTELSGFANERLIELIVKSNKVEDLEDFQRGLVARYSNDSELAMQAINLIEDTTTLKELATTHTISRYRQAAASRISDESILQEVAKTIKNKDKTVYRLIKERLESAQRATQKAQAESQRFEELTQALESLSKGEYAANFTSKYTHIKNQWKQAEGSPNPEQTQRFSAAENICQSTIEAHKAEEQARVRAQEERLEHQKQQSEAVQQLTDTIQQLQQQAPSATDLPNLDALLKTQYIRWQEATKQTSADKALTKAYKTAESKLNALQKSLQTLQQTQASIDTLIAEASTDSHKVQKEASTLLKQISWPSDFPEPQTVQTLRQHLSLADANEKELQQQRKQHIKSISQQLKACEQELDNGNIKLADQALRQAQKMLKPLKGRDLDNLHKQTKSLLARVQELRDWSVFAATPKKLELCEQMEALTEFDGDVEVKARKIKNLQEQWREISKSDPSNAHELWDRFKKAADVAYQPCREHFQKLSDSRHKNLDARRNVCEQLTTYLNSIEWSESTNYKAIQTILSTAKQEWAGYAPVNRNDNKPVQEQFNNILKQFEQRLNDCFKKNVVAKQDIIAQAEALATSDDARDAASQAKALQRSWKTIGFIPYKEDQRLWKQFRSACDQIFERLNQLIQEEKQSSKQREANALEICEKIEALANTAQSEGDESEPLKQARELTEAFYAVEDLPRDTQQTLRKRIDRAQQSLKLAIAKHKTAKKNQRWISLRDKAAICCQLESLIFNGKFDQEQFEALSSSWETPRELPDVQLSKLEGRFQKACDAFKAESSTPLIMDTSETLEARRMLCIRGEILAGLPSPDADRDKRMAYQVNRLTQGIGQQANTDTISQLQELELSWATLGALEDHQLNSLETRFFAAMNKILEINLD